jgi:hypothetical protein
VLENRGLREIFGPERGEVRGNWRKLHFEELYNFQSWLNIVRMMKSRKIRWTEHVARMGTNINAFRFLVGKPEGKRQLGKARHKWG